MAKRRAEKKGKQDCTAWLVVSYYANVNGLACSHHIDDRLSALKEQGVQPIILSSVGCSRFSDYPHYRAFSPAPSGIRHEWRHFLKRRVSNRWLYKFLYTAVTLPLLPFYSLEKLFLRLDSTWSWMITAPFMAVWAVFKHKPAVIYSTGGPLCAHVVARLAARLTGVSYVAEFQDPLINSENAHPQVKRFHVHVEQMVLKTASALIFLTREAARESRDRGLGVDKIITIYAGGKPPEEVISQKEIAPDNLFVIAHFGSLSGSRHLSSILAALKIVLTRQPELIDSLKLSLFGHMDNNVQAQIDHFDFRRIIEIHGKVDRKEALSAMDKADVLLLVQNTEDFSRLTIPSKVYEYVLRKRPILALLYHNAELKEMLHQLGHAAVELEDTEKIAQILLAQTEAWQKGDSPAQFMDSPYTVKNAVTQLVALVNRINA